MNARNQARAKGWSLHTINTSNGRRWLLVRTYHEGQEMELPYGQIEEIRRGELIFSLDALEDEIKEL
jgi:hypothetical protein